MKDLLDRRQRVAASILLSAVDLPVPVDAWADMVLVAAKVCPGLSISDVQIGEGRANALRRARALIDEMLGEIG